MELIEEAYFRVFGRSDMHAAYPIRDDSENRAWLIAGAGRRCIAKLPERRGGLTISPAIEFEILTAAADAGITARPLGYDAVSGIIFVEHLSDAAPGLAEQVERVVSPEPIARTLRVLHRIPAPKALRSFDPAAFSAAYCAQISSAGQAEARALHLECERLTIQYRDLIVGTGLCHNDLHPGNILPGSGLWLIDFEYAVRAAPIVDIASFATWHDLDDDSAWAFAQACIGTDPTFSRSQLRDIGRIQRLLGRLWEIARSDNNAPS